YRFYDSRPDSHTRERRWFPTRSRRDGRIRMEGLYPVRRITAGVESCERIHRDGEWAHGWAGLQILRLRPLGRSISHGPYVSATRRSQRASPRGLQRDTKRHPEPAQQISCRAAHIGHALKPADGREGESADRKAEELGCEGCSRFD